MKFQYLWHVAAQTLPHGSSEQEILLVEHTHRKLPRCSILAHLRRLVLALLGCWLAACSLPVGSTPTPAPTQPAAPTLVPTVTPAPTVAPTATRMPTTPPEPTATPPVNRLLPGPLYLLDTGAQILRIEPDGATTVRLTDEAGQILEFDVAANGALLYTVIDGSERMLVARTADGRNRRELLRGDLHAPLWQPNGQFYTIAWRDGIDASGIYQGNAEGRRPTLLLADRPYAPNDIQNPGLNPMPDRCSPDGRLLLARTYPYYGPDAPGGDIGSQGFVVLREDGSTLTVSAGGAQACYSAVWSADSQWISCSNYLAEPPALWRMNVASATIEALLPGADEQTAYDAFSMQGVCDGSLYVIAGPSATDGSASYRMLQISNIGASATVVRQEGFDPYAAAVALWAPNGSGIVTAATLPGNNGIALQWVPASDQPGIQLGVTAGSGMLRWGMDTNPCR